MSAAKHRAVRISTVELQYCTYVRQKRLTVGGGTTEEEGKRRIKRGEKQRKETQVPCAAIPNMTIMSAKIVHSDW
jgi:ribose 1,5-bisphosphokinase PhnN